MGQAAGFRQRNPRGKNRHLRGFRDPADQVALPDGTIPPLVDAAVFAAVQERMAHNKRYAARNNQQATLALLRAGFARCGYCGYTLVVNRNPHWANPKYACHRATHGDRCAERPSIAVNILDQAAWAKVESYLLKPELIAAEVEHRRAADTTAVDLAPVEQAIAEVERKQRALVANLVLLDPDSAALVREQLAALSAQRRTLETERAQLLQQRASREAARERLLERSHACRLVATNLRRFSYEQKRLALEAFDIRARVWKEGHEPRYEIVPGPEFREWIIDSRTGRGTACSSRRCAERTGRFR